MTNDTKLKGPASYFPSIEKTYGHPVAHWFAILKAAGGLTRMFHHDSVRRAQIRDGWVQAATTRGRVPSGRSSVRPDARVWDAANAEPFCGVQMRLEKKLPFAEHEGAQNGAHGETSGLTHMELVQLLKAEHKLGHGHANALVAYYLKQK